MTPGTVPPTGTGAVPVPGTIDIVFFGPTPLRMWRKKCEKGQWGVDSPSTDIMCSNTTQHNTTLHTTLSLFKPYYSLTTETLVQTVVVLSTHHRNSISGTWGAVGHYS